MTVFESIYKPSDSEKKLIDLVLSDKFDWLPSPETYGNFDFEVHNLIARREQGLADKGIQTSGYTEPFVNMFLSFCKDNNIAVETVYRAALNKTKHREEKMGPIHVDHEFPHKNFVMYLNSFTNAPTYIFDGKNNLVHESKPEQYKCVVFGGERHSHGFCLPNEIRIALIITFI
jgi:hypothetical protein